MKIILCENVGIHFFGGSGRGGCVVEITDPIQ